MSIEPACIHPTKEKIATMKGITKLHCFTFPRDKLIYGFQNSMLNGEPNIYLL